MPDVRLIQQEFNQSVGKTQLTLRDKEGNTSLKTAAEIMTDKKIITKLSRQEAVNIAYIAGYEHSQIDPSN